jgi:hypothetical protein
LTKPTGDVASAVSGQRKPTAFSIAFVTFGLRLFYNHKTGHRDSTNHPTFQEYAMCHCELSKNRRRFRFWGFCVVALYLFPSTALGQTQTEVKSQSDAEKAALYEKLSNYLTGTRWTGKFTVTGMESPPKTEYYEITKAVKADEGDYWNLVARIKYGKYDTTIPLPPIEIKWAGETPVITVDKLTIPGMGTFDARVVVRGGKYAGTWMHDDVGGHLFGTIKRIDEEEGKEAKKEGDQASGDQDSSDQGSKGRG